MTKPAAAVDTPEGRHYPIPQRGTGEILELPSITRIISVTDTKHLCDWNLKMVTLGAAMREDHQVQIAAAHLLPAGPPRNAELRRLTQACHEAGQILEKRHIPADRGTGYHTLTERLDELVPNGAVNEVDELGLPRPVAEIAKAYVDAMRGVTIVRSEVTVVSFAHGYAGTADRIIRFQPLDVWSQVFDQYNLGEGCFAWDAKFGTQMHPTFAMQLAAIVNAEDIWDAETQTLTPLPDDLRRDIGFVYAPSKGLVPVDLTDGHAAFLGALAITRFNERDPLQPPLGRRPAEPPALPNDGALTAEPPAPAATAVNPIEQKPAPAADTTVASVVVEQSGPPALASAPTDVITTADQLPAEPEFDIDPPPATGDPFAGLPDDSGHPQIDRAAKREWLIERLTALQAIAGGLDAVAARWPADEHGRTVPTFAHSDEHTADQLARIDQAITAAEAAVRAPFPQRNDPTDPTQQHVTPTDERLVALIQGFDALPPDLRTATAEKMRGDGIPAIKSGRLTEAHMPRLTSIMAAAESYAIGRARRIANALTVAAEKGATEPVLYAAVGATPGDHLDGGQIDTLDEIADAISSGVIVERGGRLLVDRPVAVLDAYGGERRRVLSAGQRVARVRRRAELPANADQVLDDVELVAALLSV